MTRAILDVIMLQGAGKSPKVRATVAFIDAKLSHCYRPYVYIYALSGMLWGHDICMTMSLHFVHYFLYMFPATM